MRKKMMISASYIGVAVGALGLLYGLKQRFRFERRVIKRPAEMYLCPKDRIEGNEAICWV